MLYTLFAPERRSALGPPRRALARALLALAAATVANACVRPPPFTPFKTPPEEIRERVRTIALAPLIAPAMAADRDAARAAIEPAVTNRLQASGFAVVPSDVVEKLWRQAAGDVGGIYDPVTGEQNKERFDAVQAAVYRELRAQHAADAVLYLSLTSVPIFLPAAKVAYCGTITEQSLYWTPYTSLKTPATLAVALCLNAALMDLEARQLYGIRHGVDLIETYAEQTRAVLPIKERLQDGGRVLGAVEATIGPLADAGKTGHK